MAEIKSELPELGTPEAAVESCESLIFLAVNGEATVKPEHLRYWLDLYYQVRFAYEREKQAELLGRFGSIREFIYTPECKEERIATAPPEPRNDRMDVDRCEDLAQGLRERLAEQARKAGLTVEEGQEHLISQPTADSFPSRGSQSAEEVDGAGTFASAAGGGESEQKGVAAAPLAGRESGPGTASRQQGVSAPPDRASAEDGQKDGGRLVAAPTDGPEENRTGEEPAAREKNVQPGPVGWRNFQPPPKSGAARAAAFKRETRERLQRLRDGGLKLPKIREVANGNITDDQILAILECRSVPVEVYRVLASALDKIEEQG